MGFYERIDARGVRETGRPVSFVPKGALTHHLVVAKSASLRFRRWRKLRTLPCSSSPHKVYNFAGAPVRRWYCLRQPCALRGGCGSCGSLMSNATSLRSCCHWPRSRLIVSLHSKTGRRTKPFCTHAACPHKPATGSFICGYGYRLPQYPFSFCEKETKTRAKGR